METIIFKTNMKCAGCIEKVTPALNELAGTNEWTVDLQNPDKTLTVFSANNGTIFSVINVMPNHSLKRPKRAWNIAGNLRLPLFIKLII